VIHFLPPDCRLDLYLLLVLGTKHVLCSCPPLPRRFPWSTHSPREGGTAAMLQGLFHAVISGGITLPFSPFVSSLVPRFLPLLVYVNCALANSRGEDRLKFPGSSKGVRPVFVVLSFGVFWFYCSLANACLPKPFFLFLDGFSQNSLSDRFISFLIWSFADLLEVSLPHPPGCPRWPLSGPFYLECCWLVRLPFLNEALERALFLQSVVCLIVLARCIAALS